MDDIRGARKQRLMRAVHSVPENAKRCRESCRRRESARLTRMTEGARTDVQEACGEGELEGVLSGLTMWVWEEGRKRKMRRLTFKHPGSLHPA
jgi:hypothetical protein